MHDHIGCQLPDQGLQIPADQGIDKSGNLPLISGFTIGNRCRVAVMFAVHLAARAKQDLAGIVFGPLDHRGNFLV